MYLPDFFWKYRRPITLLVILAIFCLTMLDSIHRKWVSRAGGELVFGVAFPIQKLSESAYDGSRNVFSLVPSFFRVRAQNTALRNRIGELEREVSALKEEISQEERLQKLTDFTERVETAKLVARVIGTNPTTWFSTVIIDKGSGDGVSMYLPVLSSAGLVGCVIETHRFSSKVLLLTDSNLKVSVIVQRSRARGVVQGDNAGGCVLKYVESTADVRKGDLLLTSGNSHIYPSGLPVGHVEEQRKKPGSLFQWAYVNPVTDIRKLEEVAVMLTGGKPESLSAINTGGE